MKPKVTSKGGQQVDNIFQTKYGSLKLMDLVGVRYGSRVNMSKGWGHVLYPTPELWTVTLPHRTQILYTPDISMVRKTLYCLPGIEITIILRSDTAVIYNDFYLRISVLLISVIAMLRCMVLVRVAYSIQL